GARQGGLALFELVKRLRIIQYVWRQSDRRLRRLGARLGYLSQDALFLLRVALDRLDEIRNQVGAPLILVENLTPCRFDRLILARNVIDPTARQDQADQCKQNATACCADK